MYCSCMAMASGADGTVYSGKFSLMQIFVELLVSPLKEIFMVLIFASQSAISARRAVCIIFCYNAMMSLFRGSYFRGGRPIREKHKILHHAKISRYTVFNVGFSLFSCTLARLQACCT